MNWAAWVLIGIFAMSALVTVAMVGKPRKPTSPEVAAIVVAVNAAMVLLVFKAAS